MEIATSYLWRLIGEALAIWFRCTPGHEVRLTPQASLALSGEPIGDLNWAIIDEGPQEETTLREFAAILDARRLPSTVLMPEGVSNRLASVATELGLQSAGQMPWMTFEGISQTQVEPGDHAVERIDSQQGLRAFSKIIARTFGYPQDSVDRMFHPLWLEGPGVDAFLALRNGDAASAVASFRAGSVVGIWAMATLPEHQRKGAGRAALCYAISYHRCRGAKLFYLGATEAGKYLYDRVGFRTIAEPTVWTGGQSASGH